MNEKTVMSSDNFGELAEGNIGEFLKFMPGIVIDYLETIPRTARIGGFGAALTVTSRSTATRSRTQQLGFARTADNSSSRRFPSAISNRSR